MDGNAHDLLGSFCMGSNAILHPIKLIVASLKVKPSRHMHYCPSKG